MICVSVSPGRAGGPAESDLPRVLRTFVSTIRKQGLGRSLDAPDGDALLRLRAEGDLDGDGKRSLLEREATVDEDGTLVLIGVLYMLDRVE